MVTSNIVKSLLFFVISVPAVAQKNPTYASPEIRVDADAIYYSGPINPAGVARALSYVETQVYKVLHINSRGGEIVSAMDFGEAIYKYGLDVVVTNLCNSSCANYIFSAGKNKKIEAGGFVMWHGDTRQRNFMQDQELLEKKALSEGHNMTENEWQRLKYSQKSVVKQDYFYKTIGIDGRIARIGQEIDNPVRLWALSVQKMALFGITNVSAPIDYGDTQYCTKWLPKHYARPAATCLTLSIEEINRWREEK